MGGPFRAEPQKEPIERFMHWYNHVQAHRSLDWKNRETPAQAFVRKMPPIREIVDEQTSHVLRASAPADVVCW